MLLKNVARHDGQCGVLMCIRQQRHAVWPHGRQRACLAGIVMSKSSLQMEHSLRAAIHLLLCEENMICYSYPGNGDEFVLVFDLCT